jgi:hypothetical protein
MAFTGGGWNGITCSVALEDISPIGLGTERKQDGGKCVRCCFNSQARFHAHTSEHHIKLYPPHRFLNEKSLVSKDPNAKFYYPLLAIDFLVSYFVLQGAFFGLVSFIHIGFILLVCDYLHEGFHAKGFWLESHRWFLALRELHYLHHKGHMTGKSHSYSILSSLLLHS